MQKSFILSFVLTDLIIPIFLLSAITFTLINKIKKNIYKNTSTEISNNIKMSIIGKFMILIIHKRIIFDEKEIILILALSLLKSIIINGALLSVTIFFILEHFTDKLQITKLNINSIIGISCAVGIVLSVAIALSFGKICYNERKNEEMKKKINILKK